MCRIVSHSPHEVVGAPSENPGIANSTLRRRISTLGDVLGCPAGQVESATEGWWSPNRWATSISGPWNPRVEHRGI
jgi:hypothetical protein